MLIYMLLERLVCEAQSVATPVDALIYVIAGAVFLLMWSSIPIFIIKFIYFYRKQIVRGFAKLILKIIDR